MIDIKKLLTECEKTPIRPFLELLEKLDEEFSEISLKEMINKAHFEKDQVLLEKALFLGSLLKIDSIGSCFVGFLELSNYPNKLFKTHLPYIITKLATSNNLIGSAYLFSLLMDKLSEPQHDRTKVFVVHGRNKELRQSLFEFLRAIGLKPIEWSQAIEMTGKGAPFVGEVLDAAFNQAQAIVVLLSGDDEARLLSNLIQEDDPVYERNLTPQASAYLHN